MAGVMPDQYTYDINVISSGDSEPSKVRALRIHLKEEYNLSTYGRSDYELGRSIFDATTDGILSSR